jgi:hypothetical protein
MQPSSSELWKTTDDYHRPRVKDSRNKLTESMQGFLQEASTDDRIAHEASRIKFLNILRDVKAQHDARYPPDTPDGEVRLVDSIKSACRRASETAYEYTKIMDIMVGQAPEYVALAYGAVKILLVTHNNYLEMKDNVSTWMGKIKANFDLVDHLTAYNPSKVCLGHEILVAIAANLRTSASSTQSFRCTTISRISWQKPSNSTPEVDCVCFQAWKATSD